MAARDAFVEALEAGDIRRLRRIWASQKAHLPQPRDAAEAELTMHIARTASERVSFKVRAYSHSWLTERGQPSQLPDRLKPKAERMYPQVREGVGISYTTRKEWLKPVVEEARKEMELAVEDCFANGDTDPQLVSARMEEARQTTIKKLLGGDEPWRRSR